MSKTDTQLMDELRIEIAEYVKVRERLGRPLTFQQVLLGHREVCADAATDERDGYWADRRRLLDRLMLAEGMGPPRTYESTSREAS